MAGKNNGSLQRISYGIRFFHYNISGRNDLACSCTHQWFYQEYFVQYKAPYTNPALSDGVILGAGFSQTRQIPYKTDYNNNLVYYKNDDFVKNEWYVTGAYSSRKAIKKKETFSISFRHIKVDDSLLSRHYNPGYSVSPHSLKISWKFGYRLQFTEVDNILYPLKGNATSLFLLKRGLQIEGDINRFTIRATYNKYFSYSHDWYTGIRLTGQVELPFNQPYSTKEQDMSMYLRGYEYFAIDGVALGLARFDLKKKLLHFNVPTFLKSKTYNKLPFTIYGKIFGDVGYVYSQPGFVSKLSNKFLYSGGFGIDILTLYDFKLSIECSLTS